MEITKQEEKQIREAIKSSRSMKRAMEKVNCKSRSWFRNRAAKLGIWKPTISGLEPANKLSRLNLIEGKTTRSSFGLKKRLIDENLLKDECSKCGWNKKRPRAKYSSCHLDHIDGDETNNKLENLRLLCPNCHSLTDNYCRQKKPANQYTRS